MGFNYGLFKAKLLHRDVTCRAVSIMTGHRLNLTGSASALDGSEF